MIEIAQVYIQSLFQGNASDMTKYQSKVSTHENVNFSKERDQDIYKLGKMLFLFSYSNIYIQSMTYNF